LTRRPGRRTNLTAENKSARKENRCVSRADTEQILKTELGGNLDACLLLPKPLGSGQQRPRRRAERKTEAKTRLVLMALERDLDSTPRRKEKRTWDLASGSKLLGQTKNRSRTEPSPDRGRRHDWEHKSQNHSITGHKARIQNMSRTRCG
jgi:hypothetical protein